jgi:hypothetical protein
MKLKTLLLPVAVGILLFSCQKKEEQTNQLGIASGTHEVTVAEVIQANSYTYLNVNEGEESFWVAVTKREVEIGETYYYSGGLEMKNFESKDLNKTFEKIYFLDQLSKEPIVTAGKMPNMPAHGRELTAQKEDVSVEPVAGGISVAELYANSKSYQDKTVKIKGQITKFSANIMGKNWVHIQDGTNDSGNYDLTITTKDVAKVGDVVTFEGTIALKKDFGAGYFYEVIMEDAKKLDQQEFL